MAIFMSVKQHYNGVALRVMPHIIAVAESVILSTAIKRDKQSWHAGRRYVCHTCTLKVVRI